MFAQQCFSSLCLQLQSYVFISALLVHCTLCILLLVLPCLLFFCNLFLHIVSLSNLNGLSNLKLNLTYSHDD